MENKKNILIFTDRTPGLHGKGMRAFLPAYPSTGQNHRAGTPGAKAASQLSTERNPSYSSCLVAACLIHQSSSKHAAHLQRKEQCWRMRNRAAAISIHNSSADSSKSGSPSGAELLLHCCSCLLQLRISAGPSNQQQRGEEEDSGRT